MKNRIGLFALLIPLATGCGGSAPEQPAPQPPPVPMPPPVQLFYDNAGGIRDSIRVVITNPDSMGKYWRQATSTQVSPKPLPTLDFDHEMVILVAAGLMTPDDQIHVDSLLVRRELTSDGDRVETLTIVVSTLEGCRRFRTEAFPVEIVRARKFDGPVKWAERKPIPVCRDN